MQINKIPTTAKRKFLKAIHKIQKAFGSEFGHISRNFSFGIKPTLEEQERLEAWFFQVADTKKELYKEIFADYKKRPRAYLLSLFNYATFFKGNLVYLGIKKNRNLINLNRSLKDWEWKLPVLSAASLPTTNDFMTKTFKN